MSFLEAIITALSLGGGFPAANGISVTYGPFRQRSHAPQSRLVFDPAAQLPLAPEAPLSKRQRRRQRGRDRGTR